MKLITRTKFPPGGWKYFQPQTRWYAPFPLSDSFNKTVDRIIDHRRNNPRFNLSTEFEAVANELETFTVLRLGNDPNWVTNAQKKTTPTGPEPILVISPESPSPFAKALAKLVGVKRLAGGARILAEWIGDGLLPVDSSISQKRADICRVCPHNTEGNFVVSKITKAIAGAIHEQMKVKNELGLTVTGEEELHTCNICLCVNRLKVHAPLKTIKEHTSEEVMSEFPESCWIKQNIG